MRPTAALFLSFLLSATAVSAVLVVDSDGAFVRNGGSYYLSNSTSAGGRGIESAVIEHEDSDLCSVAVVSTLSTKGLAVTISSPNLLPFITTLLPLNLSFTQLPQNNCTDSPNWVVVESLPLGEAVMLDGPQESGATKVNGWFFIRTHDLVNHYYRLVFREQGSAEDLNIGVKIDSAERRRLVVTDEPLVFKFDKASVNSDMSVGV